MSVAVRPPAGVEQLWDRLGFSDRSAVNMHYVYANVCVSVCPFSDRTGARMSLHANTSTLRLTPYTVHSKPYVLRPQPKRSPSFPT